MASMQEHASAFHTWHSNRTWSAGNPQIDPWMRDVLLALQGTLNEFAAQIDRNTETVQRIDQRLGRVEQYLNRQR